MPEPPFSLGRTTFKPVTAAIIAALAGFCMSATCASAHPLDGKTYIIQMSSSQSSSNFATYLVPPMAAALTRAGLKSKNGPGADIVINLVTDSDVGRWVKSAKGREWLYTVRITAGISAESYEIPYEGTPQFGAEVTLLTPDSDRVDEFQCLIGLAVEQAVVHYQPKGLYRTSGQACLRKK